jgi:hypothetical protein
MSDQFPTVGSRGFPPGAGEPIRAGSLSVRIFTYITYSTYCYTRFFRASDRQNIQGQWVPKLRCLKDDVATLFRRIVSEISQDEIGTRRLRRPHAVNRDQPG